MRAGVAAVKAGRNVRGRELLRQVVQDNGDSEMAWWWLSRATDDPRERWVALENVLRLNPDHPEAKAELTELMAAQPQRAERSAAPAWEALVPGVPLEADDGSDDPFQCTYCGRPTAINDHRCPHCRGRLEQGMARSRSSEVLRLLLLLMGISLAVGLLEAAGPLFALAAHQPGAGQTDFPALLHFVGVQPFLGDFLALSVRDAQWLVRFYAGRAVVLVVLLFGLRERWSLAYYLTLLALLADALATVYLLAANYLGPVGVMLNVGLALASALALISANYEFAVNRGRLRVKPDSSARSALDFYRRGHDYRRRGMWAMAVAQWRKALGLAPHMTQYYKDLGVGYAQIGRYQRSLRVLVEAQRQAPDDAEIAELIALVQTKVGAQTAPP
jgi:tetratricopeptide (TPR) repeat protein